MACVRRQTAKQFDDDAALSEEIYRVLEGQRGRRDRSRKIRQHQSRLRKLVDDRAWSAYLSVEEAVNDRADRQLMLIARWAFDEGLRARRQVTRCRRGRQA